MQGGEIARQCCLLRGVLPVMAGAHAKGLGIMATGLAYAKELGLVDDSDSAVCIVRVNGAETGLCLTVQTMNIGEQLGIDSADYDRVDLD